MYELAKKSRQANKDKAKRLSGDPQTKVDSSTWSPPEQLEAGVKTGARPISKRQYKSGGKVTGEHAKKRADRAARKDGGRAERYLTPDNLINRDVRMANDVRDGIKHVGGFKKGGSVKRTKHADGESATGLVNPNNDMDDLGRIIEQERIMDAMKRRGLPERVPMPSRRPADMDKVPPYRGPMPTSNPNSGYKKGGKAEHPDEAEDKALIKKMIKPTAMKKCDGGKVEWLKKSKRADGGSVFSGNSKTKIPGADGGRTAHKKGGKAKGQTHINVNVMPHAPMGGGMPMPPMGGAPMPPMPPRPPMAPPAGAPPAGGQMDPALLAAIAGGARGGAGASPMGNAMPMPMGRKSGGRAMAQTEHVIDNAAGGGLGRLEKIKAYGEPQKRMK